MRKRITSLLLTLVMLLSLVPAMGVTALAASGDGSKGNPLMVSTYEDWKAAMQRSDETYIKLGADIDTSEMNGGFGLGSGDCTRVQSDIHLNLNGHKLTLLKQKINSGDTSSFIQVLQGSLTIEDTRDGGEIIGLNQVTMMRMELINVSRGTKLTLNSGKLHLKLNPDANVANATILSRGTVLINGGTVAISCPDGWDERAPYVDQQDCALSSDGEVMIKGGTFDGRIVLRVVAKASGVSDNVITGGDFKKSIYIQKDKTVTGDVPLNVSIQGGTYHYTPGYRMDEGVKESDPQYNLQFATLGFTRKNYDYAYYPLEDGTLQDLTAQYDINAFASIFPKNVIISATGQKYEYIDSRHSVKTIKYEDAVYTGASSALDLAHLVNSHYKTITVTTLPEDALKDMKLTVGSGGTPLPANGKFTVPGDVTLGSDGNRTETVYISAIGNKQLKEMYYSDPSKIDFGYRLNIFKDGVRVTDYTGDSLTYAAVGDEISVSVQLQNFQFEEGVYSIRLALWPYLRGSNAQIGENLVGIWKLTAKEAVDLPIDSVTLNVPELKVGDKSGDFTLSGTNTGVSNTVTTEWKDIPADGAKESTFYSAVVKLKAENGYVFDANTNVTLIGDNWGSATGISSDGKTMTVLVSVRILHKHTFGPWKDLGNGEYHFRECSCLSQEKEPHNWEYVAGDKYKCTVCGHTIDGEMERITFVYASLRSPIDGESPSSHTTEEWVGISGDHYTVESLVWKNEHGGDVTTFEAGKIYTGTVTFKADTGFVFAQDKINADDIFSSNVVNVGDYTLNTEATILTATFKLKDNTVVRPGLQVKVKLPTLNDKIGQSFPAAELVDTNLPDDVELTTSVYENIFADPIAGSVKPNKTYLYAVNLKFKNSSNDITTKYNVSYTVTDGGDAVYHTDNLAGYGILARYQTPDTSKISSVALTVTAPKYGKAPATSATGANDTLYDVGEPTWSPAVTDGKFGAEAYTVSIPVTAASGYSFDANCLYTVNGYAATYADGKVSYTFPALTAPHAHTYGDWTMLDDSQHSRSCTAGDDVQFEAHEFTAWTPNTGSDTHSRHCTVCKMTDGSTYTETANHNWQWVVDTAATPNAAGKQHEECVDCHAKRSENTEIPMLTSIKVEHLTVAKPVKDAVATAPTTTDSAYTVANTEWMAADGTPLAIGGKFQPGTVYTVKITLETAGAGVFSVKSTYNTIEGKTATVSPNLTGDNHADSVILTYTFDATEGTYVPTKPAITTVALPDGKVGDAYSQTLAATGSNPITWGIEAGDLPDGLTLVGDTIKGTPSKAGDFKFTVKATNGGGSDTKELTIKIADAEAAKYHTVTLTDAGTGATGAGSHAAGTTVNIYAGTKSGYTFNGWTSDDVTVLSASSKNASFVMPDKDVTVKANWVYNGGGSSGGGYTYYTIKATAGVNGSISPTGNVSVREGRDQTFTITPNKGYAVAKVLIDSKNVGAVKSYTFENVKKNHTIEVVFMKASGNPQTGVFVDVPEGSYYEEAVNWAVDKGITTGTDATHFSPDGICTRAQAVTFLWRAAGSPAAKSAAMPFADVKAGSYYYDAVLWAVENGITKGTSETMFSPDATCSRAQIVTFLWRSQKSPAAGTANPFTDVKASAYYADAVLWAVKEDVTKGTTSTTFSPDANCTRAQIVTFIWRALAE